MIEPRCECHECTQARWKMSINYQFRAINEPTNPTLYACLKCAHWEDQHKWSRDECLVGGCQCEKLVPIAAPEEHIEQWKKDLEACAGDRWPDELIARRLQPKP